MSEFRVPVVAIEISPHDNADALELAQVGLYLSVVKKGQFKTGDLVAYIPEAAIVPEPLLLELGLNRRPDPANPGREIGGLAGGQYNRVKAIRLRGVVSQGIVYPARDGWVEDQDVAEELGITKWEPKLPSNLQGRVRPFNPENQRWLVKYDIENLKAHPKMFEDGELVEFSEKIHGCASEDTPVNTLEHGDIPIRDIVRNQMAVHVLSRNVLTQEDSYEAVVGWSETPDTGDWYEIQVAGKTLHLTGNHPVWLPDLSVYRQVRDLCPNDTVLLSV
jgi:hypothetical protein